MFGGGLSTIEKKGIKKKMSIRYTRNEEHLNTWSHAAGIVLGVVVSKWKERMRRWDHAAIYWHIAGSYSPITLVALREDGFWGWGLFIFVWTCALVGTIVSFIHLKEHSNLETISFIGMGLSVLVAFKPLIDNVPVEAVIWIVAEGVCYITGAAFYSLNKRRYMHSVFHFFVLAGSVCHIIAVWDMLKAAI